MLKVTVRLLTLVAIKGQADCFYMLLNMFCGIYQNGLSTHLFSKLLRIAGMLESIPEYRDSV